MPVNSSPAKQFIKTHKFDFNAHKKFLLRNYLPQATLKYNVHKIFLVQPQSVYDNNIIIISCVWILRILVTTKYRFAMIRLLK